MNITQNSYQDTRFYFDTNFPRTQVDLFYKTWVQRSCNDFADIVLVAEFNGEPIGNIPCHLDDDHRSGRIGLVGVYKRQIGQGIGRALIFYALKWFLENNVESVTVVTQGRNIPTQRHYQRCGFVTQSVKLWYHRWFFQYELV